MLQSLDIKGLFGLYSYNLKFQTCEKDAITFITGPNGYGKTTILSLIHALYTYDFDFLLATHFDSLAFDFGDRRVEIFQKRVIKQEEEADEICSSDITLQVIFRNNPNDGNMEEEKPLTLLDLNSADSSWKEQDSPLKLYLRSLPCYYIKDQRLQHKTSSFEFNEEVVPIQRPKSIEKTVSAVCDNASRLQQELMKQRSRFSEVFLTQPVTIENLMNGGKTAYNARRNKLQPILEDLIRWELTEKRDLPEYDPQNGALEGYLQLMERAVDTITPFILRLKVFERIINRSQFSNKLLQISPRFGYRFLADDGDHTILSCDGLSSGEQHILIQTFELLFRAEEKSLVLIDEPELSFHMVWQMDFLRNMREIMEIRNIQCIVGTHSPQVFDSKWDLSIDLFESNSYRKKLESTCHQEL